MIQAHIYYSGIVQGVGFRYTAQRMASQIGGLYGWVKNLRDGRVEIIVEGQRSEIEHFMKLMEARFEGSIRNKNLNYNPATGQYESFSIKF